MQFALLTQLAPHGRVTAVGDDDQSIFAFSGAQPANFLRFLDRFGPLLPAPLQPMPLAGPGPSTPAADTPEYAIGPPGIGAASATDLPAGTEMPSQGGMSVRDDAAGNQAAPAPGPPVGIEVQLQHEVPLERYHVADGGAESVERAPGPCQRPAEAAPVTSAADVADATADAADGALQRLHGHDTQAVGGELRARCNASAASPSVLCTPLCMRTAAARGRGVCSSPVGHWSVVCDTPLIPDTPTQDVSTLHDYNAANMHEAPLPHQAAPVHGTSQHPTPPPPRSPCCDDRTILETWAEPPPASAENTDEPIRASGGGGAGGRRATAGAVVTLGVNYRCPGNVVEAASALVAANAERLPKDLQAAQDRGALLHSRRSHIRSCCAHWTVLQRSAVLSASKRSIVYVLVHCVTSC